MTLSLEYHLTDADVRQEPYLIAISVPGVNAIYLPVEVVDAARYEVGMLSGDTYSYTDSQFNQMVTLMENYAVIPLVAGVPVSTKEELESCGLRVDDESFPGTLTQTARKIRYQDKNGDVSEVWAWCVMPTVQEADPSQTRTMQICDADGTVFGRVSYSLLGMSFSYGNDIALTADRMESRTVPDHFHARYHAIRRSGFKRRQPCADGAARCHRGRGAEHHRPVGRGTLGCAH